MTRSSPPSSSGFSSPLELEAGSAARALDLAAVAAGALFLLAAPVWPFPGLALVTWLALAGLRALTRRPSRARWSRAGGWELAAEGGPWRAALPTAATRAVPRLVLLWLRDEDGRRRCLVLTPGGCGRDPHRRLRTRLRLDGAGAPVARAGRG